LIQLLNATLLQTTKPQNQDKLRGVIKLIDREINTVRQIFVILASILMLSGCGKNSSLKEAGPELAANLPLTAENLGLSVLKDREVSVQDYQIKLKNNTTDAVYLWRSTPAYHSDYIIERNPEALCYQTSPAENGEDFHLYGRGVSSNRGAVFRLPSGGELSFIAPVPVFGDDAENGALKFGITVGLDEERTQNIVIYSNGVLHNESGTKKTGSIQAGDDNSE